MLMSPDHFLICKGAAKPDYINTWHTFVLSVTVMFYMVPEKAKRLRFFRDSAVDTREPLDIF